MPDKSTEQSSSQRGAQPQPQTSSAGAQQASTRPQTQADQKSQASQPSQDQSGRSSGTLQRRPALPFGGTFPLSPFSFMRRMLEDLDRTFEDFGLAGDRSGATPAAGTRFGGQSMAWSPAIEMLERDGQLLIRAELPGLSPEDVRIEIADDGSLSIQGERRSELEAQEEGGVYRTERIYGRFARVIPLPDDVNVDRAQARFENGVLEITLPRSEPSQRKRIEIQRQSGSGQEGTGPGGPMH